MKATFTKAIGPKAAAKPVKADPLAAFGLIEGTGDTVTVQGVSAAGTPIDISTVAKITAVSDNEAILKILPPEGMTYHEDAVALGDCNVIVTATWNDGSVGPFTLNYPCKVSVGPVAGLAISHGPVHVH